MTSASPFKRSTKVKATADLVRVAAMPRRIWTPEEAEVFRDRVTALLKTPTGQMTLRPIQAVGLFELAEVGGLFGPQRVGAGKTLLALLAPTVLQRVAKKGYRPLLLVPASLVEKTERDRRVLAEHWDIVPFIKVMSYEWLGRVQAADALMEYQPDLLILDECHRLKNTHASVTRRIKRFFHECSSIKNPKPLPHCAAFSGTVTKRSLMDYAHILRWCLPPDRQPLPLHFQDLMDWADALDQKKERDELLRPRMDPGDLRVLCNDEENQLWAFDNRRAARMAFRRRLVETKGVVATSESPIDATLTVRGVQQPRTSKEADAAFAHLRSEWETPDGWPIADGLAMYRHARELALGFFYKWDPRPPREWLEPRRAWAKFVRETIKHSRKLDSELQVRQWAAQLPRCDELTAWLEVRDEFEPNTVPVWIDDLTLQFIESWARKHEGLIWIEHQCVGERLEQDFGLSYYGKKGRNREGVLIDDHPKGSLVASIASNKEGRNLQRWAENLIVSMPSNGVAIEQLLGRTHRDGQEADEVVVEVLMTCAEHREAFAQAMKDADYIQATTGSPQKMLLAGVDMQEFSGPGPRWNK